MHVTTDARPLSDDQVADAAAVLARAFFDDPLFIWIEPDEERRARILGVDPPFQGRGLGGAIMQPVVERADSEGLPCYLETAKERNLVFYRKHGFDVVHEGTMPGDGPRFWTMSRSARGAGDGPAR